MANIFFDGVLISSINFLQQLSFPIVKFIIDEWLKKVQDKHNNFKEEIIKKILLNQSIEINYKECIASVEYFFMISKKNGFGSKQVKMLLNQNTLLTQELQQYLLQKYEEYIAIDNHLFRRLSKLEDLKWSLVNLRQTNNGQKIHKLYMKVEYSVRKEDMLQKKCVVMSLIQFKLFLEDIQKIKSLMIR